ncbi:MAG: hypothetical protein E6J72_14605 [Deltaproteobacteria bacterium]|nr:MAG: hypothetical protein E6J72_14605 [Deltaproteobacteria bacterium]
MKPRALLRAVSLAASITVALTLAFAAGPASATPPPAKLYKTSVTSPPAGSGATISMTKASKASAKSSTGFITFQLKVAGVVDAMSMPANVTNNNFQIDVIRPNGALVTVMFPFDIVAGKTSQKFPQATGTFPGGPLNAGDAIEIRAIRLIQGGGNGSVFGVAGLTIK